MTDVADIRIRGQAKLRDCAQHGGGIVRLKLKSLRARAAGNFNFGKFRRALIELKLLASLQDIDGRQIVTRPDQIANELPVRIRRSLNVGRRDLEAWEHVLDHRARINRERGLQRGTPSLKPPLLFHHKLDIEQTGANFYIRGIGSGGQNIGFSALTGRGRRRSRRDTIAKRT